MTFHEEISSFSLSLILIKVRVKDLEPVFVHVIVGLLELLLIQFILQFRLEFEFYEESRKSVLSNYVCTSLVAKDLQYRTYHRPVV